MKSIRSFGRNHRTTLLVLAALPVILYATFRIFGVYLNTSASLPVGLYIRSGNGPYVTFCPPARWLLLSSSRGYRRTGYGCQDGAMPLLKPVVAAAGDRVEVALDGISVNGALLPNSAARVQDSLGRPLVPWKRGDYRVQKGEIWVVSSFHSRSFDSRYFGPVPVASIISRVRPLLTW